MKIRSITSLLRYAPFVLSSAVQKRLNVHKDDEIVQLRHAVKDAQAAYSAALNARVRADPDGARLVGEIEALTTRLREISRKAAKDRPRRDKKQKKQERPHDE